nr:SPASM domain-containing protein [Aliarcobacter butzleri]
MEIKAYARDFSKNGVNRGDLKVNETIYVRDNPCSSIFNQVIINHKSEVLPCCHIRTDYEEHKTFSLGSLKDNGIFDIFKNKKYIAWRKSLLYFNKKFKYPCTNCNFMIVKKTNILSKHINKLNKGL